MEEIILSFQHGVKETGRERERERERELHRLLNKRSVL